LGAAFADVGMSLALPAEIDYKGALSAQRTAFAACPRGVAEELRAAGHPRATLIDIVNDLALRPPSNRPPGIQRLLAAVYHVSNASQRVARPLCRLVERLAALGTFDVGSEQTSLIVDLGCGTGNFLEAMRRSAAAWQSRVAGQLVYVGVDPDPPRLSLLSAVAEDLCADVPDVASRLAIRRHCEFAQCGPQGIARIVPPVAFERVTVLSVNRDRETTDNPTARDRLPRTASWLPLYQLWSAFRASHGVLTSFFHTVSQKKGNPDNPYAPVVAGYRARLEHEGAAVVFPCPASGRGCWRDFSASTTRLRAHDPWPESPMCYSAFDRSLLELEFVLHGEAAAHGWRTADRFALDTTVVCVTAPAR
jgi:SAM-dependent methyltransferase